MPFAASFANNKKSTPSSLVKSESVQSQFTSLTRARDELRHQMETADRERRRHEISLNQLRQAASNLQQDITKAHAALGTSTKKKELLTKEIDRLKLVLCEERGQLEECQSKLQAMIDASTKGKKDFIKEMGQLNQDLAETMLQREDRHWRELMMSPEAVSTMLAFGANKGYPEPEGSSLGAWKEAIKERKRAGAQYDSVLEKVDSVRARARAQEAAIDWESLEDIWRCSNSKPDQVSLFYGMSQEVPDLSQDVSSMEGEGSRDAGP